MNPVLEHLPLEREESFFAKAFDLPYFATPWHYHPEFELVLVEKSFGKKFIGNTVKDFKDGDLSFLGPNLPHLYQNPTCFYENNAEYRARSIVIHFLEKSLGEGFLSLPQAKKINKLFERSYQGMEILGETKAIIVKKMRLLVKLRGMERLLKLLEILNTLSESTEYKLLSDPGIQGNNILDSDRMDSIFQYIMKNFQREIRLEELANLVCMTRTSFCRFFHARTKRTFSEFLIDFRLNHASKLIVETNKSVLDVCYECGYKNLSNFNRQFKQKYGLSPRNYRSEYLNK